MDANTESEEDPGCGFVGYGNGDGIHALYKDLGIRKILKRGRTRFLSQLFRFHTSCGSSRGRHVGVAKPLRISRGFS